MEKNLLGSVLDYWGPHIYLIPANTGDVVNAKAPGQQLGSKNFHQINSTMTLTH